MVTERGRLVDGSVYAMIVRSTSNTVVMLQSKMILESGYIDICHGNRARLVDGSVTQLCSDHSLPKLFRVLQRRWYRLVEACQQLSQLRGNLALQCQEGGCLSFPLQSSSASWIWKRTAAV